MGNLLCGYRCRRGIRDGKNISEKNIASIVTIAVPFLLLSDESFPPSNVSQGRSNELLRTVALMTDRAKLKVGDRIRLLRVPDADLAQREREIASNSDMAGWTADTIERIIALSPFVVIDRIDEYGSPWFDAELLSDDGTTEYHSLAIMEDESWILVK